jgi:hypothetical protein
MDTFRNNDTLEQWPNILLKWPETKELNREPEDSSIQ